VTLVTLDNDLYGSVDVVAREITERDLLVEMPYVPPIGTVMTVSIGGIEWAKAEVTEMVSRDLARALLRLRFVAVAQVEAGTVQ